MKQPFAARVRSKEIMMALTVVLVLPGTNGIPALFEVAPSVRDLVDWAPDDNQSPEAGTFRVKAVRYVLNRITNTYCPAVDLIEQRSL
jgi:hypothetical protein